MLNEELRGTKVVLVQTFDNNCHIFSLVKDRDQYYLKYENDSRLIKKMVIKPDFWVFYKDGGYEQGVDLLKPIISQYSKVLSMNYDIDPEIFEILINSRLISYSKAMADLYNFDERYSSDYKYHRRDYKHSKNKQLVLEKQRKGIFN